MNDNDNGLEHVQGAGEFPPRMPFRLADQEQLNLTYPRLELIEDVVTRQRNLKVGKWVGTIELPDADLAIEELVMAPPDQLWTWAQNGSLFLSLDVSAVPGERMELWALTRNPGAFCFIVAGRALQLRLFERSREPGFVARIEGYVDENVYFLARIEAAAVLLRNRLIRSVASIRLSKQSLFPTRWTGGD